jgi:hypothetical protein
MEPWKPPRPWRWRWEDRGMEGSIKEFDGLRRLAHYFTGKKCHILFLFYF